LFYISVIKIVCLICDYKGTAFRAYTQIYKVAKGVFLPFPSKNTQIKTKSARPFDIKAVILYRQTMWQFKITYINLKNQKL